MKKRIFVSLLFFSNSLYPASMYYETVIKKSSVNDVVKTLKLRLEKNFGETRELKFSETVRSQGTAFPDYTILLSCNSKKNQKLLLKDPSLSNLLPCSVIVYDAGNGDVKVGFANANAFAMAINISPDAMKHVVGEYEKLSSILELEFKPGREAGPGNFLKFYEAPDQNFEDFNMLLVSALQGENLNIIYSSTIKKKLSLHFVCSAGLGNIILARLPEFGVFAPCRMTVFKKEGKIMISIINILEVMRAGNVTGKQELEAGKNLDRSVQRALSLATGR